MTCLRNYRPKWINSQYKLSKPANDYIYQAKFQRIYEQLIAEGRKSTECFKESFKFIKYR